VEEVLGVKVYFYNSAEELLITVDQNSKVEARNINQDINKERIIEAYVS